jgi:hypothetical protein
MSLCGWLCLRRRHSRAAKSDVFECAVASFGNDFVSRCGRDFERDAAFQHKGQNKTERTPIHAMIQPTQVMLG